MDKLNSKIDMIANKRKRIIVRALVLFAIVTAIYIGVLAVLKGIELLQNASRQTRDIFYWVCATLMIIMLCFITAEIMDDDRAGGDEKDKAIFEKRK